MNDHDAHNALRASSRAPRVTYMERSRKPASPHALSWPVLVTVGVIVGSMMLAPYAVRYVQGVML